MLETPLRTDFRHFRPLASNLPHEIPQQLRVAVADYFRGVGVDGELLADFHFNLPPHAHRTLELGLRAVGVADLKSRWSKRSRADGLVFEAAIFPAGRPVPLVATVVAASIAAGDAVVSLDDELRGRVADLEGASLRVLRTAPRTVRALRGLKGEGPSSRPGVAVGAFADLGARVPLDYREAHAGLALWYHLPQHKGQSTLFDALPEGPMAQDAIDALTALVEGLMASDAAALHHTLGPAASLVWGFHASAPLAAVVGAFERDGFDIRPLPPFGGAA